ncbi:MAG: TetR/AcrR family transcriptional regulator [Salinibacterium sp.]|nr:TetR/AcrR family transcriptional regulator [Salinibacterium sp.]MBF0672485.1 TetR/AcrR family transcriptional regulator [Salinibacterium sp.]
MTDTTSRSETEEQRSRALEATLTLVTRAGYQATTIAAVAKEAGLSESFILWHFRNKDRLFAEALEYSYRKRRATSPSWSEVVPPEKRALALRHNALGLTPPSAEGTEYRTFGLMLGLESRPVQPTARLRFTEFRGRTLSAIASWWDRSLRIDDAIERMAAAELLGNLTLSAVDGRFINSMTSELDRDITTDIIVAGLEGVATRLEQQPSAAVELPPEAARAVASLPPAGPTQHDETSTRIQILRAAESVASDIGIDAASIARICKECGCSPTSIYWFFKDKDAIFEALIEFLHEDWIDTHPRTSGVETPWSDDPLLEMMAHCLWRYSGAANLMRISLMLFLHSEDTHTVTREECLRVRAELCREWQDSYTRLFPELEDNEALAHSVAMVHAAVADGLFISQQIAGGTDSMTAYTWVLAEFMAAGIRSVLPIPAPEAS